MASRIFQWIATAWRPLTCDELMEAISFGRGDTSWSQGKEKSPCTTLKMLENCENMVTVGKDTDSVEFIHFTVLEFLRGPFLLDFTAEYNLRYGHATRSPNQGIAQFKLDMVYTNDFIAEICLTYLNLDVFEKQVAARKILRPQLKFSAPEWIPLMIGQDSRHAISSKAAIAINKGFWKSPLAKSTAADMPSFLQTDLKGKKPEELLAQEFCLYEYLTGGPAFSGWLHHCRGLSPHKTPEIWNKLHLFFFAQLQSSTIRLPWRESTAESLAQENSNTSYMPGLIWGVQNDNPAVVRMIIEAIKQEEQDIKCYFRSTYCGSGGLWEMIFQRGCLEVVQPFLEADVDHNIMGILIGLDSIIHTNNSLAILEILLNNKLNVRIPIENRKGRTITPKLRKY